MYALEGRMPEAQMADAQTHLLEPEGGIPNSRLPLVFWKGRLPQGSRDGDAARLLYERNGWTGTWVYTVYPFWHFHTRGHEVLSCVSGRATIGFGGDGGIRVEVEPGDVAVIPAGVGHRRLGGSADFRMAGGYPPGQEGNIVRPGEIDVAEAQRLIETLPLPDTDPVSGEDDGVLAIWRRAAR
jgi:uncharacterized protein YjlB